MKFCDSKGLQEQNDVKRNKTINSQVHVVTTSNCLFKKDPYHPGSLKFVLINFSSKIGDFVHKNIRKLNSFCR